MAKSRRAKPASYSKPEEVTGSRALSVAEKGAMEYFTNAVLPTGSFIVSPGVKILDAKGFVAWNIATIEKAPGSRLAKLAVDHLRPLKTYIQNNK